jgi:WD40 repeat protein
MRPHEGDDGDFEQLTQLALFESAAAAGELPGLVDRLLHAAAARNRDPRGAALVLLARAVRIDLAFLVDHPDQLFSCVYNRCYFHGSRFRPGLDDASIAREGSPLGAVVARWTATWRARGRPWVRSLRPAESGLDGPLLEEYRGSFGQVCEIGVESDRQIKVRHNGAGLDMTVRRDTDGSEVRDIARIIDGWDRATGRRLAPRMVVDTIYDRDRDVHVSPDGRLRVETEDYGRTIRLVDATRSTLGLVETGSCFRGVAFFPGNTRLALGGDDPDEDFDGQLAIVDVAAARILHRIKTPWTPFHLAISPDGRRIAAEVGDHVVVWAWETSEVVAAIPTAADNIVFGTDGRTLVTATEGVVRVWAIRSGEAAAGVPRTRDDLCSAAFSRDGARLLTGQWLCDARTGTPITYLGHRTGLYLEGAPTRNPLRLLDGRIVCFERGISLWDAGTGNPIPRPQSAGDEFFDHSQQVATSADGLIYAVTQAGDRSGRPLRKEEVRLVGLDDGRERARFLIMAASSIDLSADGSRLLVGSSDGVVRVWDTATGRLMTSFTGHAPGHVVSGVAFLIGDRFVASGADDDALCVWDSHTGVERMRDPLGGGAARFHGSDLRYWHPTPGGIAEIEAWAGLRMPRCWAAEPAGGGIRIVDLGTGAPIAWLAADCGSRGLEAHPEEPIWASGPLHFKLEGVD